MPSLATDTIQRIMEESLGPSTAPVPFVPTAPAPPEGVTHSLQTVVHAAEESSNELPNLITLLNHYFPNLPGMHILHHFETQVFSIGIALFITLIAFLASRNRKLIPGPLQNLVEMVVEALDNLICETIGHNGRKYVPFLGTLFIYIFSMNIAGIIPFLKAPTSNLNTTLSLGLCVFAYVQFNALKENGLIGYLDHLAGSPRDAIGWCMVILMFPLHIMEELIKPVSLALRLFGNILGEDLLIGAFIGLGIMMVHFLHSPVGIPLHFPFLLLAMLTSTVQALVFSLLSTIYVLLLLPHEDHHEAHEVHA
jgi:F-type H+-transporting ATPase subunit a